VSIFSLINNCISDEEIRGEMNARSYLYVFDWQLHVTHEKIVKHVQKKHNEYTDFHLFLIEKEIGQ
jgi:hypothetical protein